MNAPSVEVNGLHPTRTRCALLRAIRDGKDRIYFEAGDVWDKALGIRVTAKVRELIAAEWVRAQTPDEQRVPPQQKTLTYYVLLDNGRRVLGIGDNREDRNGV